MLKKAANQKTIKDQYNKLSERLAKSEEDLDKLMAVSQIPSYQFVPDANILTNLLAACGDSEFWLNFKKAAPIIFCTAVEQDIQLKQLRDMSFIEELLKTKSIIKMMKDKVEKGDADVDVVEYSLATKMLETKLSVLQALNMNVEDTDNKITLNVQGSTKAITIDLDKLREAITVVDRQVEENEAVATNAGGSFENMDDIDTEGITEEEFLAKAVIKIGPILKNKNKTFTKETFIRVFKYTGDYAKLKAKELKKTAQADRCVSFGKDSKKYLEALKKCVADEEQAFEKGSQEMFEKLSISPEQFEKS
jgi:hypothetical protein